MMSITGRNWRHALTAATLFGLVGLAGCQQDSSESRVDLFPSSPSTDGGEPGSSPGQQPVDPSAAGLPIVSAGKVQIADPNVMIMLQGDATAAPGATIVKVAWTQVGGPSAPILSSSQETSWILTPDVQSSTQLRFRYTAEDSQGRVNSDTLALTVEPMPADLRVVGGTLAETAENFDFQVRLRQPSQEPVVFRYQTLDGTAVAGEDYLTAEGEMTIAAGQTEATIPVVLLPDTVPEANEYFFLKLTTEIQGQTVASSAALAIFDNGPPQSNGVTIQGVIEDYPALKSQANIVAAPNGYSSVSSRELKISLNGEEQTVSAVNGSYGFREPLTVDVSYEARITQQPGRLTCSFGDGGSSTLLTPSTPITSLDIQCRLPEEATLRRVVDVAVGGKYTCALDQAQGDEGGNNRVTCWGDDFYTNPSYEGEHAAEGYLQSGITQVPDLHNPSSLDAGERHTCVIDEIGTASRVRCWGENLNGQASVPATLTNPRAVSAGGAHSCALDDTGVVCWGEESASNVPEGILEPFMVSAGADHTCVIDAGKVICWGGGYGADVQIAGLTAPTAIESGNGFSCALHGGEGGPEVTCWREGYETGYETLVLEDLQALDPVSLDVNGDLACVVHEAVEVSKVTCWFPKEGELLSDLDVLDNATTVGAYGNFFQQYYATASFASEQYRAVLCGIVDGELRCLGDNEFGQTTVPVLSEVNSLTAATTHFCAQGSNGVACWGRYAVTPDLSAPALLTASSTHSCALERASNEVVCWRDGDLQPAPLPELQPMQAGGLRPMGVLTPVDLPEVSALAAGNGFTCALANGAIECWDFAGADPAFAFGIPEGTDFFAIAGGDNHMCALRRNSNNPVCWGNTNSFGELDAPDDIVNPRTIVAGDEHSCVLDDNGVRCWGWGFDESSPPALTNPRDIFATRNLTCVNDDTGTPCWETHAGSGQLSERFPTLRIPKALGFGGGGMCVLDDEAIKCLHFFSISPEEV